MASRALGELGQVRAQDICNLQPQCGESGGEAGRQVAVDLDGGDAGGFGE